MRRVLWVAIVVTALSLGLAVAAIWGALRTYQVFTHRDIVALVECWPSPMRADEYRLVYRPFLRGRLGPAQIYQIYGDQWSVSGDVLVWRGWAQLAGFRTCYKITRLEGRYASAARQAAGPHTVYEMNGGSDWFWRWLHRAQGWIPGVEAVYGGAVFIACDPQKEVVLYATPSGFLLKPRRRWPKYPLPAPLAVPE